MNNLMNVSATVTSADNKQAEATASAPVSTRYARSILNGVEMDPRSVDEALKSLELVTARLRERGDARAVFPDVYAVITRRVKMTIEGGPGPVFLEPQWISKLAGLFCQHYLKALEASLQQGSQAGVAWDIAFDERDAGSGVASLDALLGINAHINFDLAQGLYDNIIAHGAVRDSRLLARYRHDHDLVNAILASSMSEIFSILSVRYRCPLAIAATCSRGVEDTVSRMVMFTLRQWRDRVWDDLCGMLSAREPSEMDVVLARMNRMSGRIARAIAVGGGAFSVARPRWRPAPQKFPLAA